MATVGVIGLGKIGQPLAQNLLNAGFDVIGFALSRKSGFVSAGGRFADSVQQLGREAETIVLSLPSADAVKTCARIGKSLSRRSRKPSWNRIMKNDCAAWKRQNYHMV
jgi:3-hydroxyisobutyrate dehydrogenase-like beta-hydroxyacid dehydrogenase